MLYETSLLTNNTLITLTNTTSIVAESVKSYSFDVWTRFLEIVFSPFNYKDMLWILAPMIITFLLIEFYFGIYAEEKLGWNTAFGNSLVLLFVSLDIGRNLYESGLIYEDKIKTLIFMIIFIEAILLALLDFFHFLPERFAFKISGSLPINFSAVSAIILVYTNIKVDFITISALLLLLIFMILFIGLMHKIEPKVGNPKFLN